MIKTYWIISSWFLWVLGSLIAPCGRGGKVPPAASLIDQKIQLHPHWQSALNQIPTPVPLSGLLVRVRRLLPPTAVWAAAITACGSNTQSSCWRTTMTEATAHLPLLRRTFWMRTWSPTWRWRLVCWKSRDYCRATTNDSFYDHFICWCKMSVLTTPVCLRWEWNVIRVFNKTLSRGCVHLFDWLGL